MRRLGVQAALLGLLMAAPAARAQIPPPVASPVDAPLPPTQAVPPAGSPPGAIAPTSPAPASRLTDSAAWETLIGSTIIGRSGDGEAYSAFFDRSGLLKENDGHDVREGRWTSQNGKVCFSFPTSPDQSCYAVALEGPIATFTDAKGKQARYEVQAGDVKKF